MLTHQINHPANWPLLDELHTYLWKLFPMDRFEFTETVGCMPHYVGTTIPSEVDEVPSRFDGQVFEVEAVIEAVEFYTSQRLGLAA